MGISKSYLYKLTMRDEIPHYKPTGKLCYFNRHELEDWLQKNKVVTERELTEKANSYCFQKRGGVR
jgi:excisionase family DNA binding protein